MGGDEGCGDLWDDDGDEGVKELCEWDWGECIGV